MNFPIFLHPDVSKYLDSLEPPDQQRCLTSIKLLGENPWQRRPFCDIRRLSGKKRTIFRLRVGVHRFEYFVEDKKVWLIDAFRRGRGYR